MTHSDMVSFQSKKLLVQCSKSCRSEHCSRLTMVIAVFFFFFRLPRFLTVLHRELSSLGSVDGGWLTNWRAWNVQDNACEDSQYVWNGHDLAKRSKCSIVECCASFVLWNARFCFFFCIVLFCFVFFFFFLNITKGVLFRRSAVPKILKAVAESSYLVCESFVSFCCCCCFYYS